MARKKSAGRSSRAGDGAVPILTSEFLEDLGREVEQYERGELETVPLEDVMREVGVNPDA